MLAGWLGTQAMVGDLMQPYLLARSGLNATGQGSIPACAWRSLQVAVALMNLLKLEQPGGASASASGSGARSMPPHTAAALSEAELALLARHLGHFLSCSPSELLLTGVIASGPYLRGSAVTGAQPRPAANPPPLGGAPGIASPCRSVRAEWGVHTCALQA